MNDDQIAVIRACAEGAWSGELQFPEIIQRLSELGVERYHADYSRHETTYYLVNGDSAVIVASQKHPPIGHTFDAGGIRDAVRRSQRNERTYRDFIEATCAAGCVGYFVQITGRRCLYFGRNGDSVIEEFPTA